MLPLIRGRRCNCTRSAFVIYASCSRTCYAPAHREGGNKRCSCSSVRPSVCPPVAYIANNSRIKRHSVPKFGRKIPHLRCDSHTSFKVKRSKIRVTRPINSDTHRAPYFPNGKAYTNLKLGIQMEVATTRISVVVSCEKQTPRRRRLPGACPDGSIH